MFLEPYYKGQRSGWIEVICGSMFSGKTEELIRRLKRANIAGQKVEIFKPTIDTRYHDEEVVSHDANSIPSKPVQTAKEILNVSKDTNVVGVDEAQFFDAELPKVCEQLAMKGIRVIVAGLDMDYKGNPFGPMPNMLAIAEYITKVHAICHHCGALAVHSYRLSEEEGTVLLGETDRYEARCRSCNQMGNILNLKVKDEEVPPSESNLFDNKH